MACSLQFRWFAALAFAVYLTTSGSANAAAPVDEATIVRQLTGPTRLDCKDVPLPDTIAFLADFHDVPMTLDLAEIKKAGVDLGPSQVTKKTTGRLDDTLTEILAPFNLSYMIEGGKLLVTSQPKARPWQEKYLLSAGRKK
jgi:hypothetical protein